MANPHVGILVVNTYPPEEGGALARSTKRIIERLGPGFHVRIVSALGDLSGGVPETGVILEGSPSSVLQPEAWHADYQRFVNSMREQGKGILGICFGHQQLAHIHGGEVDKVVALQVDAIEVTLNEEGMRHPLFQGFDNSLLVGVSHSDHVIQVPPGANTLASTPFSPHYAFDLQLQKGFAWGVQFHPEMDDTRLLEILEAKRAYVPDWEPRVQRLTTTRLTDGERVLQNYGRAVARLRS